MLWVNANTRVYDDTNLSEMNSEYRIFISGSDQVWNPNAVRNLYLQNFVNENKKKVSYAASIGRKDFSEYEADILIPFLSKFDEISVREQTAKVLLGKYIQKEIVTVLDPTMLLTSTEWEEVVAPRMNEQPYALFYFFSNSLQIRKNVTKFCKDRGLTMVLIPYAKQEYNVTDGLGEGIRLEKVGPKEFISAVKYADYIFTDSFHGAVFSIIFGKQFIVYERNKDSRVSMNSRLYDLLDTFDLSNRLMRKYDAEIIKNIKDIDYSIIEIKLQELRIKSLKFLEKAICIK